MNNKKSIIKDMCLIALFTTLLIISKFICIPMPFGDYLTLQLEIVIIIGFCGNVKLSFCSTMLYIIMGLIGLPVFAGGGGIDYILRPSFGYIYGFVFSSLFVSITLKKISKINYFKSILIAIIAVIIIYIFGYLHKYFIYNYYLNEALPLGKIILATMSFELPKDIVLGVLAGIIGLKLKKICRI